MGHRLSKIYTRTGDDGTTGLGDGSRVDKANARIETIGTIDELNSIIGMLLATDGLPEQIISLLTEISHGLFDLGAELAVPGRIVIQELQSKQLEQSLDKLNNTLPPLKEFILPGGNFGGALCHFARAVCRRAERRMVQLNKVEKINTHSIIYLNRLSDLLFVMARVIIRQSGAQEILWRGIKRT